MVEEIGEKALREKCKEYLYIKTADAKKAAAIIKTAAGDGFQITADGDEVQIYNFEDGQTINKALFESGIIASEIPQHRMDLEEYFLNVMGGRKSANLFKMDLRRMFRGKLFYSLIVGLG